MLLDQIMNRWFLANYQKLDPEIVFNLWWLSFYLESAGNKIIYLMFCEIISYYHISRAKNVFQHESLLWCHETATRVYRTKGKIVPRTGASSTTGHHSSTFLFASWVLQWLEEDWLKEAQTDNHHHCNTCRGGGYPASPTTARDSFYRLLSSVSSCLNWFCLRVALMKQALRKVLWAAQINNSILLFHV